MAFLTWEDSQFSVGIKTIDGQHNKLFTMINDLHDAMLKGKAQSQTASLLGRLLDYTQTHFSDEEKMLSEMRYPGLSDHRIKHVQLIKKVQEFKARFDQGEMALNVDLMAFLRDWLTNHIQKVDREYQPWMNQHGVR